MREKYDYHKVARVICEQFAKSFKLCKDSYFDEAIADLGGILREAFPEPPGPTIPCSRQVEIFNLKARAEAAEAEVQELRQQLRLYGPNNPWADENSTRVQRENNKPIQINCEGKYPYGIKNET